jgi:hypothetical protein
MRNACLRLMMSSWATVGMSEPWKWFTWTGAAFGAGAAAAAYPGGQRTVQEHRTESASGL